MDTKERKLQQLWQEHRTVFDSRDPDENQFSQHVLNWQRQLHEIENLIIQIENS